MMVEESRKERVQEIHGVKEKREKAKRERTTRDEQNFTTRMKRHLNRQHLQPQR